MKLIEICLPLYNHNGEPFPEHYFSDLQKTLVKHFEEVVISRPLPSKVLQKDEQGSIVSHDLVIYQVVTEEIERPFWATLKFSLLKKFKSRRFTIRGSAVETI